MKEILRKLLAMAASMASMMSGVFWYMSARTGADVTTHAKLASQVAIAVADKARQLDIVEKLTEIGNIQNLIAAETAAVAGIALGLAILLDARDAHARD